MLTPARCARAGTDLSSPRRETQYRLMVGVSGSRSVKRKPWGSPDGSFGPGRDPGDPGSSPRIESQDRVPCQASCVEPASPSACVSASLSGSLMNK